MSALRPESGQARWVMSNSDKKILLLERGNLLPREMANWGSVFVDGRPIAGLAHQTGTCRLGTDPASSVADTDCKAHEHLTDRLR